MFTLTPIVVALIIATLINAFVTYISWQRRKNQIGLYFALGSLALTIWTTCVALDYAATPVFLKIFFAKLEYTSYNLALPLLTLFVLSYTGYEEWLGRKSILLAFTLIPLSNILLAWTNDWHGLLWSDFKVSTFGENTLIFEHGPAFVWTAFTAYLMVVLMIVPLIRVSLSGSDLSQRQARLMLFGLLIPVGANVIYLFQAEEFQGVDWTSISFSATALICVGALYGTRLLELAPIARDKLVSSLSDGMIGLDLQNRIIDINQAAAQMIGTTPEALVGHELTQAMPSSLGFLGQPTGLEIKLEWESPQPIKRSFDVQISPLRDNRQNLVGRLIIFHDVTERKQVETERAAWAALLQATFDSSTAGILVLDTNGQTILANKQVAKIWPLGEIQPVFDAPHPFLAAIQPFVTNYAEMVEFVESLNQHPNEEGFMRMVLTDERIFDIRTAPYYTGHTITGQVWTFENVSKRIAAEKAEVLIEERRRISQEAHDGLLQGLVGLRLQLNQWHKILDQDPPRLHSRIDELQSFVTESIEEMRRFILALRPAPLETGFFEAVQQLGHGMQRYYQLEVAVDCRGLEARLHRDWEQALFRVVQESLSNIGKHAHATQAWVMVDLSDLQTLTLTIRDNGRGFEPAPTPGQLRGFGLSNMADRIKSLGGQFKIESVPGQGTTVCVQIPYNSSR